MKKTIRYSLLMSMLIICILGLFGCGKKTADEEQIRQDLETNEELQFLREGEQIKDIVIEKRQTEKEQKTDTVWCTITTNDTAVSCEKQVVLSYGLYDKTGWVLDHIEVEPKEQWDMTPLKGIDANDLSQLLYGQGITLGEDEWLITKESLLKAEIENQQTDLEQKTDQITISLALDDKLERIEGTIEVLFTFQQEWKYDSLISKDGLTVSVKDEYRMNRSENDLISKIIEKELPVGETKQTIIAEKQEISDFKIEEQKAESKGSRQIFQCSYKVSKSHIVFEMESTITYAYQDGVGWNGSVNKTISKVISSDIAGNWSGTYLRIATKEKAKLHISEVKEDGTVTADYTFAEGSYELSGTWNPENLELWLEAGNWIEEPEKIRISNDKDNITGVLNVNKERLELKTQQGFIYFTVTKD